MRSQSPSPVQKRDAFLKLCDGSLQVLHCSSLTVLGDMEGSQECGNFFPSRVNVELSEANASFLRYKAYQRMTEPISN